jgi:hypothetical protein
VDERAWSITLPILIVFMAALVVVSDPVLYQLVLTHDPFPGKTGYTWWLRAHPDTLLLMFPFVGYMAVKLPKWPALVVAVGFAALAAHVLS